MWVGKFFFCQITNYKIIYIFDFYQINFIRSKSEHDNINAL